MRSDVLIYFHFEVALSREEGAVWMWSARNAVATTADLAERWRLRGNHPGRGEWGRGTAAVNRGAWAGKTMRSAFPFRETQIFFGASARLDLARHRFAHGFRL